MRTDVAAWVWTVALPLNPMLSPQGEWGKSVDAAMVASPQCAVSS